MSFDTISYISYFIYLFVTCWGGGGGREGKTLNFIDVHVHVCVCYGFLINIKNLSVTLVD